MYRHCTGVDIYIYIIIYIIIIIIYILYIYYIYIIYIFYIYILQLSVTAACKASKCLSQSSSAIPIFLFGEDDPIESVQVEGGWRCALHDGDIMGI